MANIGREDPDLSYAPLLETIPPVMIPDKLRTVGSPTPYVWTMVNDLVCLLASQDIHVRDTAREALGSELSPGLYGRLLKHVERYVLLFCPHQSLMLLGQYSLRTCPSATERR